jgi:hypothetical protein
VVYAKLKRDIAINVEAIFAQNAAVLEMLAQDVICDLP